MQRTVSSLTALPWRRSRAPTRRYPQVSSDDPNTAFTSTGIFSFHTAVADGRRALHSQQPERLAPSHRHMLRTEKLRSSSTTSRHDLARSSVQNILAKEGVPARRNIIGEQHRTEPERLRHQGLSTAQIASRFAVSESTALRAMRRLAVST